MIRKALLSFHFRWANYERRSYHMYSEWFDLFPPPVRFMIYLVVLVVRFSSKNIFPLRCTAFAWHWRKVKNLTQRNWASPLYASRNEYNSYKIIMFWSQILFISMYVVSVCCYFILYTIVSVNDLPYRKVLDCLWLIICLIKHFEICST